MMDNYKHKGRRERLVEQLKQEGISDTLVLEALSLVPRHVFIDSAFEDMAYQDRAFPILEEQTISRPKTVAFQSEILQLKKGEKVLEIGTGSGYQAAVLVAMGVRLYTIERIKSLFDYSKKILKKTHLVPYHQSFGDGYQGLPGFAPFDKIIVTCGAEELPLKLLEQLKIGGIMIIPLGKEKQTMTSFLRISEDKFEKNEHGVFEFVPMKEKRV